MESNADGTTLPYGETLRALGWQFDTQRLTGLRLDMRGEDVMIEAHPVAQPGHIERAHLALTDLAVFLHTERRHGRADAAPAIATHPSGLGYQEALRVLGQALDRRGLRLARVIEHADGLIVQGLPADAPGAALVTELLRWETLQAQHERAIRRREGTAGDAGR